MLTPTALLIAALLGDSANVYDGRANQTHVAIPRIDSTVVIDGHLDEPVWSRAARLTGFSQYQPVDGRPAEEPTEVRVWYSADAIYFGIKATEIHGDVVRATHANRALRTICRTPLIVLAAESSTRFTRPPNTGDCASVANFTPGGRASMP